MDFTTHLTHLGANPKRHFTIIQKADVGEKEILPWPAVLPSIVCRIRELVVIEERTRRHIVVLGAP